MQTMVHQILLLLLLFRLGETFAFVPAASFLAGTVTGRPNQGRLLRVTGGMDMDMDMLKESSKASKVDTNANQAAAIAALQKLRLRQTNELQETERLLDLVTEPADRKVDASPASLSTAASLLSGADYGFVSRSEGVPQTLQGGSEAFSTDDYGPPSNIWILGTQQFVRNYKAIKGEYADEPDSILTPRQVELQEKLGQLRLNSTAIWERELADGPIRAPWIIKLPYLAVCYMLDTMFEGSYVPSRFFLLETVARMPYFSYISCLHLYETLGFWRRSSDVKRVHFAQELNEYGHLLIMESLGGDQSWWVRFIAQHSALAYYYVLCGLFFVSPSLSYRFSELLETHAVNTYSVFLENNEAILKDLPPSKAAVDYYSLAASDPFYAEFQTTAMVSGNEIRRPGEQMQNMHDVFSAICSDEGDHVHTMVACLDAEVSLRSPSVERRVLTGIALVAVASYLISTTGISVDLSDITGSADVAGDAAMAIDTTTIAEFITAGVVGFAEQLLNDEEARDITSLGVDMVEGGAALSAMEQTRKFGVTVIEFIAKVL